MLTAVIFAFLGAFGAFLFMRSRSARAKAITSPSDDRIREALKCGELTDDELLEMGLDPAEFQTLPEPAQFQMLRQAFRDSDISIRVPGVSVEIGSLRVNAGDSVRIQSTEVSISIDAVMADNITHRVVGQILEHKLDRTIRE